VSQAKMQANDRHLIHCLNCRNTSELYKALDKCKVGDVLDLEVLRETGEKGKEHISVTLEAG